MKVNKEQASANRDALLEAAGRLFRENGIDGVGVAQLCNAAGLTHGALYSHFGSKEALAAEAFAEGQRESQNRMKKAVGTAPSYEDIVDYYVSHRHRDNMTNCCPILAASSEAARQDEAFRENYAKAVEGLSKTILSSLKNAGENASEPINLFIAASMVGVVAVARGLKDVDPKMSDTLLETAQQALKQLATI